MKVKALADLNVPFLGRDVTAGEVIDVPDGTNLPADYFQPVTDTPPAKPKTKEG